MHDDSMMTYLRMLLGTTNPECMDARKGWGFPMTSALLAGALAGSSTLV